MVGFFVYFIHKDRTFYFSLFFRKKKGIFRATKKAGTIGFSSYRPLPASLYRQKPAENIRG